MDVCKYQSLWECVHLGSPRSNAMGLANITNGCAESPPTKKNEMNGPEQAGDAPNQSPPARKSEKREGKNAGHRRKRRSGLLSSMNEHLLQPPGPMPSVPHHHRVPTLRHPACDTNAASLSHRGCGRGARTPIRTPVAGRPGLWPGPLLLVLLSPRPGPAPPALAAGLPEAGVNGWCALASADAGESDCDSSGTGARIFQKLAASRALPPLFF